MTTIIGLSVVLGILLCVGGIVFMDPIMRAFGAKDEDRFHESVRFALKGALVLTVLVAGVYILLSRPLILAFNRNPVIVDFGRRLLISQMALYPAFGLCYMMTITYQRCVPVRPVSVGDPSGPVLCAVHPDAAPVPGCHGHLFLPARRGYPHGDRVPSVRKIHEIHRLPEHGGGMIFECLTL